MNREQKRETGATMVEYALGVALIIVAGLGAFNFLSAEATDQAANQADCISTRPPPPSCVRSPVPAPTTTTSTIDPGPTTTGVPPSTDPPITTTTTTPPQASVVGGPAISSLIAGDPDGNWQVVVPITVEDPDGAAIEGAIVNARLFLGRQSLSVGCITDATGGCPIEIGPISGTETAVRLLIEDVVSTPPPALPLPTYPLIPKPGP